jgi:hypothetical protein
MPPTGRSVEWARAAVELSVGLYNDRGSSSSSGSGKR